MSENPVGELVRALRVELGLSQEAAAERAGILRTELSTVENGRNKASSYEMRIALSKAFDLSHDVLDNYLSGRADLAATACHSGLKASGAAA